MNYRSLILLCGCPEGVRVSWALLLSVLCAPGAFGVVVADKSTGRPLANVSAFDRKGALVGVSGMDGRLPYVPPGDWPVTLRLMGFRERSVSSAVVDTAFMSESMLRLPEVVVESRHKKMLHILAYVREFSTLSTYTDTVSMFREKMVDFMLPGHNKTRFSGWRTPRILSSRSYYRFTNAYGLDSVSDKCNYHFTWSDWVGILPSRRMPERLVRSEYVTDTLRGKYSPTEMWVRNGDRVTVDVNVLADTASRKWVPNLSLFFKGDVDFEQFRLRLTYADVVDELIKPMDLAGYSFNIESQGRGHGMFRFNRRDEPFFVSTYSEVYILDKEYVAAAEARKWERNKPSEGEIDIYVSHDVPELQPDIKEMIARVEAIDHDGTRLAIVPDKRVAGGERRKLNFGEAVFQRIKGIFGIDDLIGRRKQKQRYRDFLREQRERNDRKKR